MKADEKTKNFFHKILDISNDLMSKSGIQIKTITPTELNKIQKQRKRDNLVYGITNLLKICNKGTKITITITVDDFSHESIKYERI